MKNKNIFKVVLILIAASVISVKAGEPFKATIPQDVTRIELNNKFFSINGKWVQPELLSKSEELNWDHISREKKEYSLGGMSGSLISDIFENPQFRIERQVWISKNQGVLCLRNIVTNVSKETIKLKTITPLKIVGQENFQFGKENSAKDWRLLLQYPLKNDRPEIIKPTANTSKKTDPFFVVHDSHSTMNILMGYLSYNLHKASIKLDFTGNESKTEFLSLTTPCDFEGISLPANGQRSSQWVYIESGKDLNELIENYADRVGIYHSVSQPKKNAPSVYCTWYYHSYDYDQKYFEKDIAAFRKNRMPFDVFLIDECWQLNQWGDFEANEKFPTGMKKVAEKIRTTGYIPGIWTPPFLVDPGTKLEKNHPEWLLKNSQNERIIFNMNQTPHWVLDPTYPGVCDYLEEKYRMLSRTYGYKYFKFDFMRAIFLDKDQQFYDSSKTSLEAYRMGLAAIKRGAGSDAYLNVCGGHYGASLGLANSQRSGSDVLSIWHKNEIPKYRQSILRTWMSRLWHVDPDAMMIRRAIGEKLKAGKFTDSEANTNALNQYIGGGLVSFCEDFSILDDDRLALYKHVIPSINTSSKPLDYFDADIPHYMVSEIHPQCSTLTPWITIACVNWGDTAQKMNVILDKNLTQIIPGNQYIVSEFFSQEIIGIFTLGEKIALESVSPHQSKLLRITAWNGKKPVLVNTDLHFSSGGIEITDYQYKSDEVSGQIENKWQYPVRISIAFPASNEAGYITKYTVVPAGKKRFRIVK